MSSKHFSSGYQLGGALATLVLMLALGVTAFGMFNFDWQTALKWPAPEASDILYALALPAAALGIGSFTRYWGQTVLVICALAACVTFGPPAVATVCLFALGSIAIGAIASNTSEFKSIEDGLLALVLGIGLVGFVVGLSAPLRIHFDFVHGLILLAAIVTKRRSLWPWLTGAFRRLQDVPSDSRIPWIENLAVSSCILSAIALSLFATSLESGYDAMVSHLFLAEKLRTQGYWNYDQASNFLTLMPKLSVWVLASFDVVGGELALKAGNFASVLVTAGLLAGRVSSLAGRKFAAIVIAAFLAAPITLWIASTFFEEGMTLTFLTAAGVLFIRNWSELRSVSSRRDDWQALASLGFAVGAKAQMLLFGALGVAIVSRRLYVGRSFKAVGDILIGCLIFAIVSLPSYVRAELRTGNPLYPIVVGQAVDPRWERPFSLAVPYDMIFKTTEFMEALPGAFAYQYIILLAATIAALFASRSNAYTALALATITFLIALLSNTLYARYQVYAFPFLMLLLGSCWHALPKFAKTSLVLGFAVIIPLNAMSWNGIAVPKFRLEQLLLPEQASDIPPERHVFAALNALYGREAVVYVAGVPFSAGLFGSAHAVSSTAFYLASAKTRGDFAAALYDGGFTHIVATSPVQNPIIPIVCKLFCIETPTGKLATKLYTVDRLKLAETRQFAADGRIDIGPNTPDMLLLGDGWDSESWGAWSVAPSAQIILPPAASGVRQLEFRAHAFTPLGSGPLEVTIAIDNRRIDMWVMEESPLGTLRGKVVDLPPPTTPESPRVVSLSFSHVLVPAQTIVSQDTRTLALGLVSVRSQ